MATPAAVAIMAAVTAVAAVAERAAAALSPVYSSPSAPCPALCRLPAAGADSWHVNA
jgi:hypothetical protein